MNTAKIGIAGLLAAGVTMLTLTACGSSDQAAPVPTQPPAQTQTQAPSPPPATDSKPVKPTPAPAEPTKAPVAKPKPTVPQLGPAGYQKARLGMTFAQAKAAGLVRPDATLDEGCGFHDLMVQGRPAGKIWISPDRGVESIAPDQAVRTAEGLTVGATLARTKAIYPALDMSQVRDLHRARVPVPGNAGAVYRVAFVEGVVKTIGLQLLRQDCYE